MVNEHHSRRGVQHISRCVTFNRASLVGTDVGSALGRHTRTRHPPLVNAPASTAHHMGGSATSDALSGTHCIPRGLLITTLTGRGAALRTRSRLARKVIGSTGRGSVGTRRMCAILLGPPNGDSSERSTALLQCEATSLSAQRSASRRSRRVSPCSRSSMTHPLSVSCSAFYTPGLRESCFGRAEVCVTLSG